LGLSISINSFTDNATEKFLHNIGVKHTEETVYFDSKGCFISNDFDAKCKTVKILFQKSCVAQNKTLIHSHSPSIHCLQS
jgi:hypothetical protein